MLPRRFVLLALMLASATVAAAQTPVSVTPSTRLAWDHPGDGVETWTLTVDGGAPVAITPECASGLTLPCTGAWSVAFPPVTPGPHTLIVGACNQFGCALSDPFAVVVGVVPERPARVRIRIVQ